MNGSGETVNVRLEYDNTAEYCARLGLAGQTGDPIPNVSQEAGLLINRDLRAFAQRVADFRQEMVQRGEVPDFEEGQRLREEAIQNLFK